MRLQLRCRYASDTIPEAKEGLAQPAISEKRKSQYSRVKDKDQADAEAGQESGEPKGYGE